MIFQSKRQANWKAYSTDTIIYMAKRKQTQSFIRPPSAIQLVIAITVRFFATNLIIIYNLSILLRPCLLNCIVRLISLLIWVLRTFVHQQTHLCTQTASFMYTGRVNLWVNRNTIAHIYPQLHSIIQQKTQ